jgi:hypothetical protein
MFYNLLPYSNENNRNKYNENNKNNKDKFIINLLIKKF